MCVLISVGSSTSESAVLSYINKQTTKIPTSIKAKENETTEQDTALNIFDTECIGKCLGK